MRGHRVLVALTLVGATLTSPAAAGAKRPPSDNQIEKQAVLKRADLAAGWSSEPSKPSDVPDLPVCAGIRAVNTALEPISAVAPDFVKDDFTWVQNAVVVLKTDKKAAGYLKPYRDPDAAACLEALTKDGFDDPAFASVRVTVTPGKDAPRGADDAVTFSVQATVTTATTTSQPSRTNVVYLDLLVGRIGRAIVNFSFSDLGQPLPEQGEMVDVVIGRLQAAGV